METKWKAAENYRKILSKYQISSKELSIVHSRNDEIGIASRIKMHRICQTSEWNTFKGAPESSISW